jgi:predicted DNA binding CopG/RHH family protein
MSLDPNEEEVGAADDREQISEKSQKAVKIGRPRKAEEEKYKKVGIRLHPEVLERAKAEAARRGVGYQSVINETLLEHLG